MHPRKRQSTNYKWQATSKEEAPRPNCGVIRAVLVCQDKEASASLCRNPQDTVTLAQLRSYSASATKTAVVRAGTDAVPDLELKVDCLVAGSLECCWIGCRCRAKP